MKNRYYFLIVIISLFSQLVKSQDSITSQSLLQNSFLVNFIRHPGYTGAGLRNNAEISYQNRWISSPNSQNSLYASFNGCFNKKRIWGYGIYYKRDNDHFITDNSVGISISFNLQINANTQLRISPANPSFHWRGYSNLNKLITYNPDYFILMYPGIIKNYFDFSSGLWLQHRNIYLAASWLHEKQFSNLIGHFNESYPWNSRNFSLPTEVLATAGMDIPINQSMVVQPVFEYNFITMRNDGSKIHYITPALFLKLKNHYVFGTSFKNLNTWVCYAGVTYNKTELDFSAGIPVNYMWQFYKIEHIKLSAKYFL